VYGAARESTTAPDWLHLYTRGGKPSILPGLDLKSWLSTMQDPKYWAVIEVSSVISTVAILDEPLKASIRELLACPLLPPSLPYRLSSWNDQTTGHLEIPLKSLFCSRSFTILAWMRRGDGHDTWRCLFSVEYSGQARPILWIGCAPRETAFSAQIAPNILNNPLHRVELTAQISATDLECPWMHIAFMQRFDTPCEWSLFVNGHKKASLTTANLISRTDDQVRLVLGTRMYGSDTHHILDDKVESVNVCERALSEKEIAKDAVSRLQSKGGMRW